MKKPKLLKVPRQPKAKTPAAMQKYLDRLKEVEKANAAKLNPWKKAQADKARLEKAIAAQKARIRGL